MTESERPAERAKKVRKLESRLDAPSTVTYAALPSEHDEFKNHFKPLLLGSQCISGMTDAIQLRAKVADTGKTNASAKTTFVKRRVKKRPIVAEERINALVGQLMEAHHHQNCCNLPQF